MTSISGTSGSPSSLTSYYSQLLAAKAAADDPAAVDETDSDTAAAEAEIASLAGGTGTSADTGSLSTLLGSGSDGGSLASLLGSNFTDTNSLLAQISALASGSATTSDGATSDGATGTTTTTTGNTATGTTTDAASQQQKIAGLLADMMQTEQRDFLSLLI